MSSNISELCKQSMRCKGQEKKREIDYLIASELGCNRKDVETIFKRCIQVRNVLIEKRRNT